MLTSCSKNQRGNAKLSVEALEDLDHQEVHLSDRDSMGLEGQEGRDEGLEVPENQKVLQDICLAEGEEDDDAN